MIIAAARIAKTPLSISIAGNDSKLGAIQTLANANTIIDSK